MFLLNGVPLPLDTPFRDAAGNSYPANWIRLTTIHEKNAIGITEVPDPEPEIIAPAEPDPEPEVPSE
jgi:hypothetical protein